MNGTQPNQERFRFFGELKGLPALVFRIGVPRDPTRRIQPSDQLGRGRLNRFSRP
ncbi:MAG: hypothetical protein AAAB20_13495 [Rhizobium sp.]|uniref:hypothetical protein n=1 Tax=Rhizobium sp. TaxID=391 RepID=UPI000AC37EF1